MSKANGFLPLRRGIWEHVRDGSLTPIAALAYIFMLSEADTRTGIWKGSAQCIATALRVPKSTAKYVLKCLDGKYIRRFSTPGKHSCYPILLHRFVITQGQHVGLMLDAINSANERELEFLEREELPASSPELVQHVGPQRIKENREKRREKKNTAAKPTPPADSRFQSFIDFAHEAFKAKHGIKPSWQGKDWKGLRNLLASNKSLGMDDLQTRWQNYLQSTEAFTAKHGGSLAFFCARVDSFIAGPLLAQKGGGNGKVTIDPDQRTRENLEAAGLLPN